MQVVACAVLPRSWTLELLLVAISVPMATYMTDKTICVSLRLVHRSHAAPRGRTG